MRCVDINGRIAWRTPNLCQCLKDLELDAHKDLGDIYTLTCEPNAIPFSTEALKANLLQLQNEWETVQASRDRNAIYRYLSAVFELVTWWDREDRAVKRAYRALHLRGHQSVRQPEPFAAVIFCTADRDKVDDRTRSKWSRVMGTLRNIRTWMSRCEILLSTRAVSTNVRSGSPVVWGDRD